MCTDCQKQKRRVTQHAGDVQRKYGITREDYDALFLLQGGVCAICRGARPYNLEVDHNHVTGEVRGLLCKQDNRKGLPAFRDNPARLRAAAHYLENPPARQLARG